MDAETPTPGQVATNEIAKQVVALIFGVATALILMRMQRKMMHELTQTDEVAARMEEAKRSEKMWETAAAWSLRVPKFFWRMADKARAAYEAERP